MSKLFSITSEKKRELTVLSISAFVIYLHSLSNHTYFIFRKVNHLNRSTCHPFHSICSIFQILTLVISSPRSFGSTRYSPVCAFVSTTGRIVWTLLSSLNDVFQTNELYNELTWRELDRPDRVYTDQHELSCTTSLTSASRDERCPVWR